ncbi:hypothetical protein HLB44_36530 [Aquincola sp. S2]|uniref:Uncharacterized protein n=1 Tax=Pseudaquabacterium terrae TaxID=2732868 RepID=A0ABX2EV01_9BURK|nr:hypothetical protein [Aquabacterium terrae]NRF72471.1 hypothetical protein [Aquabacterium terrae]
MIDTRPLRRKVPDASDWAGYKDDLDVRYAHKLMFGKSVDEVQDLFGQGRSIERASELLFTPRTVFQYYVFAFAAYVLSDAAAEDSDSASPFLLLLINREKRDPGSVREIYNRMEPIVQHVASRQEFYDADPNIYGNFKDHQVELAKLCNEA